jgi:hypothetical protein
MAGASFIRFLSPPIVAEVISKVGLIAVKP